MNVERECSRYYTISANRSALTELFSEIFPTLPTVVYSTTSTYIDYKLSRANVLNIVNNREARRYTRAREEVTKTCTKGTHGGK